MVEIGENHLVAGLELMCHGGRQRAHVLSRRRSQHHLLGPRRADETRDLLARSQQARTGALRMDIAGAGLDRSGEQMFGNAVRDRFQHQRSARIVEIGEAIGQRRKISAHFGQIKRHVSFLSLDDQQRLRQLDFDAIVRFDAFANQHGELRLCLERDNGVVPDTAAVEHASVAPRDEGAGTCNVGRSIASARRNDQGIALAQPSGGRLAPSGDDTPAAPPPAAVSRQ